MELQSDTKMQNFQLNPPSVEGAKEFATRHQIVYSLYGVNCHVRLKSLKCSWIFVSHKVTHTVHIFSLLQD